MREHAAGSAGEPKYIEHPLVWPSTLEFRLYQKRIAEAASERNTLVILPTALGKTVISALVAADMLYNYRDSKVLVMAPTRPLVMQHRETFHRFLKLREKDTAVLTGRIPAASRRLFWEGNARVFFSTPQVVRNDLLEGRLNLRDYGLLVFDECHRAVKEYAYTDTARIYVGQAAYPLILGMTASPGSDISRVQEVCRNLYIEHIEFRSEEDPDVKPYIHPIDVEWKQVDLPAEYISVKSHIRRMLDKRLRWLHESGILKCKPEYATRKRIIEAGDELRYMLEAESVEEERGRIFNAIMNQSIALTLFHMLELLETQGPHTLKAFMDRVRLERREKQSYAILTSDPEYKALELLIQPSRLPEHPKVELLKQIIGEQLLINPPSRMLVFTQYRDTVSHLVSELQTITGVRAERFIGQASRNGDRGLSQEEQAERIRMLEDGRLNVLVATSIAEEGLDIPSVDRVIFYEPIPSEIRYIQRRGRTGRKAPGKVTILAANQSLDMIYLYASRKRTEKMKRIAETIGMKLQPIVRKRAKPPLNPMTPDEIREIEKEAERIEAEEAAPYEIEIEAEMLKDLNRKAAKAAKLIYMRLLEAGAEGLTLNEIAQEMEAEGITPQIAKAALNILMKDEAAAEVKRGKYAPTSSVKRKPGGSYEIRIEKIYPGSAVVTVNDKWRARLEPQDYNGPRKLIKKNSRFLAIAELYKMDGRLYIKIKDVIQKL
ncbi:MAG: DEAD/DEAH box helicase [Candidatus Brockarchaeota archaeon]|nr:DEAD/DEAH box helicase [Candidatus Brockarchaeota archaeon]